MSTSEIQALIALLVDDDPSVREAVEDRLRSIGPPARDALADATDSDDPKLRSRARLLEQRFRVAEATVAMERVLAAPELDLEEACVLLARIEAPDIDGESIRAEFERMTERLSEALNGCRSPRECAESLGRVLGSEEGFEGNAENYYDPGNSYIHEVLARKVGIPISLSAVYMIVGRRAGLTLRGVGMPCHFLVHMEDAGQTFYLDPFAGGRILTGEACRKLLAGFRQSWRDEYLSPVEDRDMVRRMMANLIHIYQRDGDQARLSRLYGFVNALQGRAT